MRAPDRPTSVICLVEQPVQLCGGRSQSADDLAFEQWALRDPALRFEGQSIQQQVAQVARIPVVLEHLLEVSRASLA